jgi:hypothetical protein
MAPDMTLRIYCENFHNFEFIHIELYSNNIDKSNNKYHGKFCVLTAAVAHVVMLRVISNF